VTGFYRYAVRQRAVAESPFYAVERPGVDEESQTTGLTRDDVRRLVLASRQDGLRSEALMYLLTPNGLRITEALSRDVEDLDYDQGHRILRLDRGRLFFHMLAAIAEFEHDLIVERTVDGLAAARARGRKGGPKFKMTPTRIAQARSMYDAGGHTVQQIADTFGVSRPTIYRHLAERAGTGAGPTK